MQKTVIGWDIDTVDQVLTLPQVIRKIFTTP